MLSLIASDVRHKAIWNYGNDTWRSRVKALVTEGTAAMILYRLMQGAGHWKLTPVEWLLNKLNTIVGGCLIGRGAEFGPGFVLIHAMGVVINGQVRGGKMIFIEHQVTIGADRGKNPRLGDDVFIGAGAKIIGGVTIGSHVRIGANAVVLDDVPSNCTAVGVPARIIRHRESPLMASQVGGDESTRTPL